MTQDEIIEMVREAGGSDVGGHGWTTWVGTQSTEFLERFANLVAAKEREALAQPEQEPVAFASHGVINWIADKQFQHEADLYTTPPQRTQPNDIDLFWRAATTPEKWVGLTNNELQPIADEYRILFGSWVEDFARAIEAKLKEKNCG